MFEEYAHTGDGVHCNAAVTAIGQPQGIKFWPSCGRGCDPSRAPNIFCDAKSRCRPAPHGLAAAVQLRLRVALGFQPLQRCSGHLSRRALGGTVATHQIASRWAGGQVRKWEEHDEHLLAVSPLLPFPLSHLLSAQPAWLSSDSSSFVNCRAIAPRECESLRRLQFSEGG